MSRVQAIYRVQASSRDIESRAAAIAVEQSIEMPPKAVRNHRILSEVVGRVENITPDKDDFLVTISLALETTGLEAGQMMNMLFGNSSLHPDMTLVDVELSSQAAAEFGGPRFGIDGLRHKLGARQRALTCTALKPQGSSVEELAALAGRFAHAGIDIIKDDHGLANQRSAPFAARVAAVQRAIDSANQVSGQSTIYAPSLTGGPAQILEQVQFARNAGVGALLIAPMVSGCGALQELTGCGLPILAHPALAGSTRIASPLLLGKLFRLFGADAVIYPNHGGRFSFSPQLCHEIATAARDDWAGLAPALPVPAGGMNPDHVEEMIRFYGEDVMLLIGGALLEAPDQLVAGRHFVERVAKAGQKSV